MKYLKQIGTGRIYVWTEALAMRNDMIPFEKKEIVEELSIETDIKKNSNIELKQREIKKIKKKGSAINE